MSRGAEWRLMMRDEHELRRLRKLEGDAEAEASRRVPHFMGPGNVEMKSCSACGSPRPLDRFGKRSDAWDGLECACIPCRRDQKKRAASRRKGATYSDGVVRAAA